MLTENRGFQEKLHIVTIEDLVPQEHYLRKLEAAIDFSFIYDEVRDYYCPNNGRPGIDPVVIIKYLLIGYLDGIESERRIEREIQVNMAYRWFLGLDIDDRVPDHSTISQLRRRKFNNTNLFRRLFERVLALCIGKGLVDGKVILTDSTHVKANASRRSETKVLVEKEAAWYMERLDRHEALERERLEQAGKIKPKQIRKTDSAEPALLEKSISTTDSEAGFLQRPGKPQGMHYLDHQSVDAKNGIIVDVAVTAGNVHDAAPYLDRIEYMTEKLGLEIETVGVDSAYDVSLIHQELAEKNIRLITPANKNQPRYKVEFSKGAFMYDASEDVFICPAGRILRLYGLQNSVNNVSREYRADPKGCKTCQLREKCLAASQNCRRIQVNIFEASVKRNHEGDGTPEHLEVLRLRQIWCEGRFASQKAHHNLRRLLRWGLEAAESHCLLSATAMNLKRMIRCLG
jgi:Transposase and inactivated derivatives